MKTFLSICLFVAATFVAPNAMASNARDISVYDQYCCCKAGCPAGSYFCRSMCQILGGSCSRSASNFPDGADATLRNSCMGAYWSWSWWSSGIKCPSSCPSNS